MTHTLNIQHLPPEAIHFPALEDASGKYLITKHTMMTAPAIQVLDF